MGLKEGKDLGTIYVPLQVQPKKEVTSTFQERVIFLWISIGLSFLPTAHLPCCYTKSGITFLSLKYQETSFVLASLTQPMFSHWISLPSLNWSLASLLQQNARNNLRGDGFFKFQFTFQRDAVHHGSGVMAAQAGVSWSHCTHSQAGSDECLPLACFLSFTQPETPVHGIALLTFRVNLPTSFNIF